MTYLVEFDKYIIDYCPLCQQFEKIVQFVFRSVSLKYYGVCDECCPHVLELFPRMSYEEFIQRTTTQYEGN